MIESSLLNYAALGVAMMALMPVPMAPTGQRDKHGCPLYRPKGKAPFDVYGYQPSRVMVGGKDRFPCAVFVGAELKCTSQPETSLSIVAPDRDGSGLEFHQLDALAAVAKLGGIAKLVWNNAGEVGVIGNAAILSAYTTFMHSLESERSGKGRGKPGSRSIPWSSFRLAKYETGPSGPYIDWLRAEHSTAPAPDISRSSTRSPDASVAES